MDDDQTKQIANQTEIPVSEIASEQKKTGFKPPFVILIPVMFVLIIVTVAVWLLFFQKNTQDARVATLLSQAKEAYEKGNFEKTEQLLKDGLAIREDDPKILSLIIKTKALEGNQTGQEKQNLQELKPFIDLALKTSPEDVELLTSIGYVYETAGDYKKALEIYNQALAIGQSTSDLYFHKGHVLFFLDRFDEGKQAYEESIKLDGNNPLTLMAFGNIASTNGDLSRAYDLFKKASDVKDLSPQLKSEALTAASLVRAGEFKMSEAIELAKQAIDASPNFSPALATYGFLLSINGNAKDGFEYQKKAIETNPRISKNYYQAALVLRAVKQYDYAISYQRNAISKINDDNTILGQQEKTQTKASYTYELAKTYSMAGGNPDTIIFLQQALLIKPDLNKRLVGDYGIGFFSELSGNPQFQALL